MTPEFPLRDPLLLSFDYFDREDTFGKEIFDLPSILTEMLLPINWAVEGMVPEGCILLTGKPRIGKTSLALQLAIAVASGGKALGRIQVDQGEVLYLALEDDKRSIQARAKRLLNGRSAPAAMKIATDWLRIDEGGDDELEHWLRLHPKTRMIVIDTFQKIRSKFPRRSDYYSLNCLTEIAHKFGVTLLVIQHTRKANPADELEIFTGRSMSRCLADGMLVLRRTRSTTEATLRITGRDVEESTQALKLDKETRSWEMLGEATEVWQRQEQSEITNLLEKSGRPMRNGEIADCLDRSSSSVRKTLAGMVKDNVILMEEKSLYSLNDDGNRIRGQDQREQRVVMTAGP